MRMIRLTNEVGPLPMEFKPSWSSIRINLKKKNIDKKVAKAWNCAAKQGYIQTNISKYFEFWQCGMQQNFEYIDDIEPFMENWEQIEAEVNVPLLPILQNLRNHLGHSVIGWETMPTTF